MRSQIKKPKISYRHGKWWLKYYYVPRSFVTYGMSWKERQEYQKHCFIEVGFPTWKSAFDSLKANWSMVKIE